mgnify:CR=1 FL=1
MARVQNLFWSIHTLSLHISIFQAPKTLVLGPIALHLLAQHIHHPSKHLGADFQRLKTHYFGPAAAGLLLFKGKSPFPPFWLCFAL